MWEEIVGLEEVWGRGSERQWWYKQWLRCPIGLTIVHLGICSGPGPCPSPCFCPSPCS